MHLFMVIGGTISIFGGIASYVVLYLANNNASDAAAFLNGTPSNDNFGLQIALRLAPFMVGIVIAISAFYVFLGIRRQVTKKSKIALKLVSIFTAFTTLIAGSFFSGVFGLLMIIFPLVFRWPDPEKLFGVLIGVCLLGVGLGSVFEFVGSFRA